LSFDVCETQDWSWAVVIRDSADGLVVCQYQALRVGQVDEERFKTFEICVAQNADRDRFSFLAWQEFDGFVQSFEVDTAGGCAGGRFVVNGERLDAGCREGYIPKMPSLAWKSSMRRTGTVASSLSIVPVP